MGKVMESLYRYILCFIIGIILFLVLNSNNGFSVGIVKYQAKHRSTKEILDTIVEANTILDAMQTQTR